MRTVLAAALRRLAHRLEPASPVMQQVIHYHQPATHTPAYPVAWTPTYPYQNRCGIN
jgi:hypothetical protein